MAMAAASPARRAFLRGGRSLPPAIRPPGALAEAAFLDRCKRCAACIEACPQQVLIRGDGGFPRLDPRLGECTFCGDCSSACAEGALQPALLADWPWRVTLGDGCLSLAGVVCQGCRDACDARAIRFPPGAGLGAPQIDLDACTGCGACVAACPAAALTLQQSVSQRQGEPA